MKIGDVKEKQRLTRRRNKYRARCAEMLGVFAKDVEYVCETVCCGIPTMFFYVRVKKIPVVAAFIKISYIKNGISWTPLDVMVPTPADEGAVDRRLKNGYYATAIDPMSHADSIDLVGHGIFVLKGDLKEPMECLSEEARRAPAVVNDAPRDP